MKNDHIFAVCYDYQCRLRFNICENMMISKYDYDSMAMTRTIFLAWPLLDVILIYSMHVDFLDNDMIWSYGPLFNQHVKSISADYG